MRTFFKLIILSYLFYLTMKHNKSREVWIDWLRVIACFMVMIVHSTEPFYLGGDGGQILCESDMYWSAFFDSLVRMCVPLFLIASSYLQFPIHYSTAEFFRRRAIRILIPFAIWSVAYAFYWGNAVENLQGLTYNFNYSSGHLWFVYMIVGVYIIMPMLSPWAEKVSKRELQVYLGIWLFTTTLPILRDFLATADINLIYGKTGLPRQAVYPLWGEASWNAYGTFYYISGMIGYLLLGLYLRRFVPVKSWAKTLPVALPTYLVGFAITFGGFIRRVLLTQGGEFPVCTDLPHAVWWETTWNYDSLGVVLMTIGAILMMRKISCHGFIYQTYVVAGAKASYGMYLIHMLVLSVISAWWINNLGTGLESHLGIWTTPVQILLTATCTFTIVSCAATLMRRIPKIGKYLMG